MTLCFCVVCGRKFFGEPGRVFCDRREFCGNHYVELDRRDELGEAGA